jgi:hypothetical protein
MADFLTNLVARSLGRLDAIQPRASSRFEPQPPADENPAVLEIHEYREASRRMRSADQRGQRSPSTEQQDYATPTPAPETDDRFADDAGFDAPAAEQAPISPGDDVIEVRSERWQPPEDRERSAADIARRDDEFRANEAPTQATYPVSYQDEGSLERAGERVSEDASFERYDGSDYERWSYVSREREISDPGREDDFDAPAAEPPEHRVERAIHTPRVRLQDADLGFERLEKRERPDAAEGVTISIGRVEVRAASPAPAESPRPVARRRFTPRLSLEDYLRRTRKGRR